MEQAKQMLTNNVLKWTSLTQKHFSVVILHVTFLALDIWTVKRFFLVSKFCIAFDIRLPFQWSQRVFNVPTVQPDFFVSRGTQLF